MSLDQKKLEQLADEVLTFIEQREAEQVAYGIYDVTMTGAEVIESFQPSEDVQLADTEKEEVIRNVLQQLGNDLQIIRFNKADSPTEWVFRSRIAETVRLLTKLRQRIVFYNYQDRLVYLGKCVLLNLLFSNTYESFDSV